MAKKSAVVGVRMPDALRERIREEVGPDASEAAYVREAVELRLAGSLSAPADEETQEALAAIRAHIRQPDDEAAVRFAVRLVAEILNDDDLRDMVLRPPDMRKTR